MIIAGEASGDEHGANLVIAMKKKDNNLFFCGIGGQALKNAGVKIVMDSSELAVVGITEVLSKASGIIKGIINAKRLLKDMKPAILVLIDFPEFNLIIAKKAKKLGIPVLYYISPQMWAWRKGRIKKIVRLVDHMAVILPFEDEFYKKYNIPVSYVGHPLLDTDRFRFNASNNNDKKSEQFIGLLPGSREKEVSRNFPVMLKAALILYNRNKDLKFAFALAPGLNIKRVENILKKYDKNLDIEIVTDGVEKVLKKSVFAIVASGTATLESAFFGVPAVVIYKTSFFTYWLGRALIRVNNISLVNLIAGRNIVPELIQSGANHETISNEVETILKDKDKLKKIKEELSAMCKLLGGKGASYKVSEIAFTLLGK
mmetsp:Transcript_21518/g.9979  ORF Transcript_21518/g.9979 Transcript_21518/m.9979 type:complete len:372 (+) Transcript_21518:10154-11269(+)